MAWQACDAWHADYRNHVFTVVHHRVEFGRQAKATCCFARGSIGKASRGAGPVGGALCSHKAVNTKAVIQQSQCMLDAQCLLPSAAVGWEC